MVGSEVWAKEIGYPRIESEEGRQEAEGGWPRSQVLQEERVPDLLQLRGRGRQGGDSRDLAGEGLEGRERDRSSLVQVLGLVTGHCWHPCLGSASSTWSFCSGTKSWLVSPSGSDSEQDWDAHRHSDTELSWTCSPDWPTAHRWRLSLLSVACLLYLLTSVSGDDHQHPDPPVTWGLHHRNRHHPQQGRSCLQEKYLITNAPNYLPKCFCHNDRRTMARIWCSLSVVGMNKTSSRLYLKANRDS